MAATENLFDVLPNETCGHIFSMIPSIGDLLSVRVTCQRFRDITDMTLQCYKRHIRSPEDIISTRLSTKFQVQRRDLRSNSRFRLRITSYQICKILHTCKTLKTFDVSSFFINNVVVDYAYMQSTIKLYKPFKSLKQLVLSQRITDY